MEQTSPTTPPQTPPPSQPTPQPVSKKGNFFSFFGKMLFFVIIAGVLLTGGYFLGTMGNKTAEKTTPTPTTTQKEITQTEVLPSPTPVSKNTKTVKGGLTTSKSFKAYALEVPPGWTDARETTVTADIDKLTLTKEGHSVTIYQAAMGGGGCLYPGDKPSEMAQTFTEFTDINGKGGQFKRSWNTPGTEKTITYTICQKSTVDNSYSSITTFGGTTIVSPNPANATILTEIDVMIASITAQ